MRLGWTEMAVATTLGRSALYTSFGRVNVGRTPPYDVCKVY